MNDLRPAVFLDRDGVLNRTYVRNGVTHPPASVEELELLPGVPEALVRLASVGLPLIVVTNQPDVARGTQTRESVEAINDRIRALAGIVEVLTCYHDRGDNCSCRKPLPGLLLQAAGKWRLNLKRSFMVGDRWSDVLAGQAVGCLAVLVETPWSGANRCDPEHVAEGLPEAADWILSQDTGGMA